MIKIKKKRNKLLMLPNYKKTNSNKFRMNHNKLKSKRRKKMIVLIIKMQMQNSNKFLNKMNSIAKYKQMLVTKNNRINQKSLAIKLKTKINHQLIKTILLNLKKRKKNLILNRMISRNLLLLIKMRIMRLLMFKNKVKMSK